MTFLITGSSSEVSSLEDCEIITRGEFTVAYGDEVELRQEKEKLYIFQGAISNKKEIEESISFEAETCVDLFQRCHKEDFDLLNNIDGSYTAFVIDDSELKIFRDIFGSKPVYFAQQGDSLLLSSNIRPILNAKPELQQVNKQVAADYLANGLVDHRRETFFEGIKRLKPREKLHYSEEKIRIEEVSCRSMRKSDGWKTVLESNIENLKPEADYYCPVSGGIDSAITSSKCRKAEHIHLSLQHGTKDELYMPSIKSKYSLDVQEVEVEPIDLLEEVEAMIQSQEEPTAYPAIPAQSLLYKNMEVGKTVVSGTGADELFYGYSWFLPFYLTEKIKERKPIKFLKELVNYRKSLGISHIRGIKDLLLKGWTTLPSTAGDFVNTDSTPLKIKNLKEARRKHLKNFYFPHMLRSIQKNSQYHQVDVRLVFLSEKLFKLLNDREPDEHFQDGLKKYLLRSEFKEELPEKVYERKQKTGFVSAGKRIYTPSTKKKFLEVFKLESFQNREQVKSKKLLKSLEKGFLNFETAYRFYNYEVWMQEFLD